MFLGIQHMLSVIDYLLCKVGSNSTSSWVRITTPSGVTYFFEHRAARTSRVLDKFVPWRPQRRGGAEKTIAAWHSIPVVLPLLSDMPKDELEPTVLPHAYSLGDFFRNTTGARVLFEVLVLLALLSRRGRVYNRTLILLSQSVSLAGTIRPKNYRILARVM
ncbi:hypothetical protein EDC04DRAFT_2627104, partial [Pisolithus marmoratus]